MTEDINQTLEENLAVVIASIKGERGSGQVEVAYAGLELLALVLRKNADYGGSALKPPVMAPGTPAQQALRCRMSDKIQRVLKLAGSPPEVASEGINDAIDDLAGYGILDKVLRNREHYKKETNDDSNVPNKELETPGSCAVSGCPTGSCGECSDSEV
tara:strand:- start:909 stop:1382 length:474 start_codon:yes stop_codon:yes gene_type:complete